MRRFGGIATVVGLIAVARAGATDVSTTADRLTATTTSVTPTSTTAATVTSEFQPTTTTAAMGKAPGGEVAIGDDQEPTSLNPYAPGGDNFITRIIGQAHQVGV